MSEYIRHLFRTECSYCSVGLPCSVYQVSCEGITDILAKNPEALSLVDLSLSDNEIYEIMKESGFNGSKLGGIVKWVSNSIKSLFDLQQIIQTNDFSGMSGIH